MCDGYGLSACVSDLPGKEPHELTQRLLNVSGWAGRCLRRVFEAGGSRMQKRQTARILSRLPDSVLADIGFRRVDIWGQPLPEARYDDLPVLGLVPMEINPTFIERTDTNPGSEYWSADSSTKVALSSATATPFQVRHDRASGQSPPQNRSRRSV